MSINIFHCDKCNFCEKQCKQYRKNGFSTKDCPKVADIKLNIGDKVIDKNGYTGVVTNLNYETGQIQVQQKPNVWCTYYNEKQLKVIGE